MQDTMQGTRDGSLDWVEPLEEEMETHSTILAFKKIPITKEPGKLQSLGMQSQTRLSSHACILIILNMPISYFHTV